MTSGDHQPKKEEVTPSPTPRPVDGTAPSKPTGVEAGLTKLLFAFTNRHRGKALELDSSQDTMRVLGPRGEELAVVDSEVALDHLLGCAEDTTAALQDGARPLEDVRPRPKPFRVSARGGDGREYEGLCPVVGRERIFLEVTPPPPLGTQLRLAIVSSGDVARPLRMKGTVTWVCHRPDEFGFGPGVLVVSTWASPELLAFLAESVHNREPRASPAR